MTSVWTRRSVLVAAAIGAALLGGCGASLPAASTLPNGDYQGKSAPEDDGSYGVVSFTVVDGTVKDATFTTYDADGTAHDQAYVDGRPGAEAAQRARLALEGEHTYTQKFVETGDQNAVDSVAGASLSYRQFQDAVEAAIGSTQPEK